MKHCCRRCRFVLVVLVVVVGVVVLSLMPCHMAKLVRTIYETTQPFLGDLDLARRHVQRGPQKVVCNQPADT